jgi:hypothetical protein
MSSVANTKYKVGDKLYHHKDSQLIREILWMSINKYIESDKIQYTTISNQKGYPPLCMEESALDKYYIKMA